MFLSDTNEAPFKNLQPLAVLKTNPDGAGIVQAIGPLKTLATPDGAAADVRRRFLIVSESDDASRRGAPASVEQWQGKVMQHVSDVRLLTNDVVTDKPHDLATRINELGNKSTQLLLFLTFAILGAVTLMTRDCSGQERLVRAATWWWMLAVFPVLLGRAPSQGLQLEQPKVVPVPGTCKVSVSVGVRDSQQCWCHSIPRARSGSVFRGATESGTTHPASGTHISPETLGATLSFTGPCRGTSL